MLNFIKKAAKWYCEASAQIYVHDNDHGHVNRRVC